MDCGKKTLFFFTFCALVGTEIILEITTDLEFLISVPSTHIGDTELVFTSLSIGNVFLIDAVKNQTKCINSTDPLCSSMIKAPAVDVSVTSTSSDEKYFTYSGSFNESVWFIIGVDPEVSVERFIMDSKNDTITVTILIEYNHVNRRIDPTFPTRLTPTTFSFNTEFIRTKRIMEDNGKGNGQSTLRCAPVGALVLLALTPFYFSSD
ncbi:uncharacterized protein LOC130291695 [Hyla sarda]|uniref:uncharacterized protein LOC130291695 n=1 Tax=Hyla sarda TaxID=327740 RepID=UPI0024C2D8E1|nr:uncharacterized protein LOC130291695 [Hyla sarda]